MNLFKINALFALLQWKCTWNVLLILNSTLIPTNTIHLSFTYKNMK